MNRLTILLCVCSIFLIVTSKAEDLAPYKVKATASRTGDEIQVSIAISSVKPGLVPMPQPPLKSQIKLPQGATMITETRSAPKITMHDGQTAIMVMGQGARAPAGSQPADPTELESGTKVELISIKGQDKLLVVCTVIENSATVWADAATIPVTSKDSADSK
ncbi:MAG TPA: hypothetical protein VHS31_14945 [Tepidisphaeraceae bacterium]|jgi:hypothetical protein|nr:hypothetical protein [Tepidisphaeraceae bacterium]